MTIVALRSLLFGLFVNQSWSNEGQQNTSPTLRAPRLSIGLIVGAIAIGVIALAGYALGNASIASLSAHGKPVAAGTALAFIVLGSGLLAIRTPAPSGFLNARRAALIVIVLVAADLMSAALSRNIEEWQAWSARGGVIVHPYLVTGLLLAASGSALILITTKRDFAGHVIATAVLLISLFLLFGDILKIPSFLDRSTIGAPVALTGCGLVLISFAELLVRPRGWVLPLLSRTSAGLMSRLLLPAAIVVPFVALGLRDLIVAAGWFTPEAGIAVIVTVNVVFSSMIVLVAGVILYKGESARMRLAAIVESSGDAIIGSSSAALIETWNPGAERMYGYTAAEAIGGSPTMLAPPERRDEAPRILERFRRGESIDPFETVRVAKDGRLVDVWLSVAPVMDDLGRVAGVSSIAHDITRRKKDEEAIRHQAEQYRAVLATSTDGFWLADLDGRLLDVNDAFCRMTGYSREELLTMTLHDLDAFETREETSSHIQKITESGFDRFETKHRTKDNRIIDIEASVSQSPTTGQVLGFGRDITQRKQEQEALRSSNRDLERQIAEGRRSDEAHRQLATVVEQAVESIVITDLDGTIVYVNPAFERITGYSREEAIGQNPRFLNSGKQSREFYQQLWATIRSGGVWQGRFINRSRDGSLHQEEATISPVRDASGTIINYVAIQLDMTADIALAEQLRHAQKIEAVGTLAAGVAHDFNNLLQAMLSIVQLLKRKSVESSRQVEYLEQLEQTVRRGSQLTRQLLLFARRETSTLDTIDLNQILRDLSPFLHRVVRENIRLTIEAADVPLLIRADRGQIEQVIMNLAVNAIDAMSGRGALSIVAHGNEHTVCLSVSDTGSGIADSIRDRIFEPFFTTKEAGKGTGLGLSVVHGIITAHGGRIDVRSPAGGGTTFQIELPRQNASMASDATVPSADDLPNGQGERVLLVEDEAGAREGLTGILDLMGYSVVAVGTGEDALAVDREVPFSILLTDSMLPGMPGIEVVHRLRERWPGIKAILMSGYTAPGVIDAAVAANEIQFLQKPFDMADLARTLKAVLRQPDPSGES